MPPNAFTITSQTILLTLPTLPLLLLLLAYCTKLPNATDDLLSNIALGKIWDTEASIRRCLRPIHVARWCSTPSLMGCVRVPIIINCKRWNTPLHGKNGFLIAMGGGCFWAKLLMVFNFGTNVVWMLTGSLLKLLFERVGAVVWGALTLPLITLSLQQLQGGHSSTNHAQLQLHVITTSVCFASTTVLFFSLWFDCPWSILDLQSKGTQIALLQLLILPTPTPLTAAATST